MSNDSTPEPSASMRDVFAERLPFGVVSRMTLGVVRQKSRRLGRQVSPNDITIADLSRCVAWDLISVEGIGHRAWRLLLDELYRLGLTLHDRDPRLVKLTEAGLVAQERLASGTLSKKATSRAKDFLEAHEKFVYQIDYESNRAATKDDPLS